MRDILILGIVILSATAALARPWIGVMLWNWLSIMNPHRFAWGLAYTAPLAAIAAGSTLIGLVFSKDKKFPLKGAPAVWLAVFFCWLTISWFFGIDREGDYALWERVMKIYLMIFVALSLLNSKFQIQAFVWVTVLSLAVLSVKGGLFTILSGGSMRVYGPPESFIEDNNDFALATVCIIPMMHFLSSTIDKKWAKYAITGAILLSAAAALGSQSRGGFLALTAMGGFLWWRSKSKLVTGILLLLVVVVMLPFMPDTWWDRMATIQEYQQDESAMGRINAWIVAWQTALHYPTGAGMFYQHAELFERFGVHETVVRAAHSIYFQILGNHGIVGLMLYLAIWISTFRTAGWLRKNRLPDEQSEWTSILGSMVQVSLVGFAVGGAFLSLAYFDLPYNLMVAVVLTKQWVKRKQAAEVGSTSSESLPVKERRPFLETGEDTPLTN